MTPKQFKSIRKKLKLSLSRMADEIGVTDRNVRYYEKGDRKIPKMAQILLRYIVKFGLLDKEGK